MQYQLLSFERQERRQGHEPIEGVFRTKNHRLHSCEFLVFPVDTIFAPMLFKPDYIDCREGEKEDASSAGYLYRIKMEHVRKLCKRNICEV